MNYFQKTLQITSKVVRYWLVLVFQHLSLTHYITVPVLLKQIFSIILDLYGCLFFQYFLWYFVQFGIIADQVTFKVC